MYLFFFFFNDTATTEIYTLSLHDALPIYTEQIKGNRTQIVVTEIPYQVNKSYLLQKIAELVKDRKLQDRSEEHTSELQSRQYLVCRLLLEKKKKYKHN